VTAAIGPIWLVGCGAMGGALLSRWKAVGLSDITIVDPAIPGGLTFPPEMVPAVIVLAVKPQVWKDAVASMKHTDALVISIMAGVTCAALTAELHRARIVRTIPNLASGLGKGVTALYSDSRGRVPQIGHGSDRDIATTLMSAAGACFWLDREADFDAVTAVSGSGPAYVFAFIEALAAAGVAAGLSPALSSELALRTVTGAAALAAQPRASPALLREAVSSAGGTTLAGLNVLQSNLPALMRATVAAAQRRSRELGGIG